MFHKNSDNNIDEDKLSHKDKDDKEDRSDDWTHAAVLSTVVRTVTFITQRVLHHKTSVCTVLTRQSISQSIEYAIQCEEQQNKLAK